ILADAVLHSTLPADEVLREKDVILREIAMTQDDPDNRLWESVFATAFREHPYRQPVIGHRDVFAAVSREELLGYYRDRYVPNNIVVVIAGGVDPARARGLVEEHFGKSARSSLGPVLVPGEPAQLGPRRWNRAEKVEVARAALTWPIPGLADRNSPVLDLLAIILGGGDSSVLWQELREKRKLVHSVDASAWNPGSSGLFCVSFTCDGGGRPRAEEEVLRILAAHARPSAFTRAQVRKAYMQSVASEVGARKTVSGQAARLGLSEVVVGDLDHSRAYFGQLAVAGPADLARAVREFLVPERITSVSIEPEAAGAAAPRPPVAGKGPREFEEITLANGARILLQPDRRLPNLHLRLVSNGGPLLEKKGRRGSSALLATLLTKDTKARSAAATAKRIEEVGGSFSSASGDNTLSIAAEVLPSDAELALGLVSDAVLHPLFRDSALATERQAQLAALREENDDVVALARRLLRRRFFGQHPFAIGAQGDEAGVEATTAADLRALRGALLTGPGTVLAVAGDFDRKRLLPRLRDFLQQLPKAAREPAPAAFEGPSETGSLVERQPREQAVVMQGFPGAPIGAADYYAGEVADELFSGMASRLFERVREQKALAYFIRSGRTATRGTAMFSFSAGTQPGKEDEIFAEIAAEVQRVASGGVGEEELRRCQVRLKAGMKKVLQANSSRAMQAAVDSLQGRGPNHVLRYDELIDSVTLADLSAFAARHLNPERSLRLVVRP
ncbi:MAG TPA: pitrilysin family protein, partial [Opitutaceae bacterium]